MLALALPFLTRNWRLVLAAMALAAGLGLLAWERHQGAESVKRKDAVLYAKAVAKAQVVTTDLAIAARQAADEAAASRERIVYRTRTIIQRIPQDVPTTADPRLGVGWVRNYADGLGLPEDSRLAGRAADQPYISAADALAGIDANSAVCLQYKDAYQRVVGLYDQAAAKVNGFSPR